MEKLTKHNIFEFPLFKWSIIIISFLSSIHTIFEIATEERTIGLAFSITVLLISILAIITVFINNKYANEFVLYFIVIDLILVNITIEFINVLYLKSSYSNFNNFFGIDNLVTLFYIVIGLAILFWYNKLLGNYNKPKLYGNLYILIGILSFLRLPLLYRIFSKMEFLSRNPFSYSFTSFSHLFIKSILAFLIISLGYLLSNKKMKLKPITIILVIILFIYGIV